MKKKLKKVLFAGGSTDDTSSNPDPYLYTPNRAALTPGTFDTAPAMIPAFRASPTSDATNSPFAAAPDQLSYNPNNLPQASGPDAPSWMSRTMSSVFSPQTAASLKSAGSAALPFASNIANAFRNTPMPQTPTLVNPVTLSRIDLSDARNRIARSTRGQNLNADKTLDPQSAAAVRNANLAKEIEGQSQVSEQEAFLNARQRAEQAGMNLNVESINANAQNRYKDSLLERNIAHQREQSQNLSNAADKAIEIQNQHNKADLDLKKIGVLSQMWKDSGVYDRMLKKMKDQGIDDPTGILAQENSHALGGPIYAFGGFAPATKPFPMSKGRATQQGNISPFGASRSLRLSANPEGKFNPKSISHVGQRVFQDGGGMGMDTPDDMLTQMKMGGTMSMPSRPKAIRRMDFAGIEHMADGGPFQDSTRYMGYNPSGNMFDNYLFNIGDPQLGKVSYVRSNGTRGMMTLAEMDELKKKAGYKANTGDVFNGGADMSMLNSYVQPKAKMSLYLPPDTKKPTQHAMGGQMGHIPAGAFEEDHINGPRPTPGPDDTSIGMDIMKYGGIHIKKANRGKFTAYKARTGKTTAEALHSSDPHVRKMANFARNASKWNHHAMGGPMKKVFC